MRGAPTGIWVKGRKSAAAVMRLETRDQKSLRLLRKKSLEFDDYFKACYKKNNLLVKPA
jgi:hypothetical protein